MTTMIREGNRRCDAVCYNAKGTKCRCICGGVNHAKGMSFAVHTNRALFGLDKAGGTDKTVIKSNRSVYEIVADASPDHPLIIRDTGHNTNKSLTNDAENVVADLVTLGLLPPGRRLYYYDSEGTLDEIKVVDGKFAGFAPGPRGVELPQSVGGRA